MGQYGLSDEVYATVQRIIKESVLSCQSMLVEALLSADFEEFTYDNIEGIYPDKSEEIDELEREGSDLEDENADLANEIEELESEIEDLESDLEDLNAEEYDEDEDETVDEFDERNSSEISRKATKLNTLQKELLSKEKQLDANERRIEEIETEISDLEDEQREPQEWMEAWLVDSWLLGKLRKQGEVVLSNDYGDWWLRGCSGQSIELDNVMHTIAKQICRE